MKIDSNRHFWKLLVLSCFLMAGFWTNVSSAQSTDKNKKAKKDKPPEPERVLIDTKDGIELRAEWFAGVDGKETIPIILIHDWDSDRNALLPLAGALQKELGYAVIVPDLRGHGESMTAKGHDEELKRSRFKKSELASMIEDIDSCRRFLQAKNDEGELNLNMLAVISFGKMSIHAMQWSISDWSWAPIRGIQQGQNVKTLIMVSPRRRFKSLNMTQSLKHNLFSAKTDVLPMLLIWGEDHESSSKDGEVIYNALKKSRNEPETFEDQDERWAKQTLFNITYDSDGDWDGVMSQYGRDMLKAIGIFIDKKIVAKAEDFDWQKRALD